MNVESAVRLVNQLVYKPGWLITATDHSMRFEGTICVRFEYPAIETGRGNAELGYPEDVRPYANFPMIVADCTDEDLYYRILCKIREIEIHEARETLRVQPTYWAPFHPHQIDGMRRWAERTGGSIEDDLRFGIA